jgi:SAM-dependent methyltransferase
MCEHVDTRQLGTSLEVDGFCPICGSSARFRSDSSWLRDFFHCEGCSSIPRERAFMVAIEMFYPEWRTLTLHESSPGRRGASQRLRRECPGYSESFYDPAIPLGTTHPERGYRCENLEKLTFSNQSFDLVLTQDVFEHIFHPDLAIKEIERVLRPGGAYIMTVPLTRKSAVSERRASIDTNGKIIYHKDIQYHGNPINEEGILVTIDWGYDILDYLNYHSSLQCTMIYIDDLSRGIRADFIEVILCRKSAVPSLLKEMARMSAEEIYAAMRQTEMVNWVGGGDPAAIGAENFASITENLPLRRDQAILDFGCGIGRTSVLLAEFLNEGGRVVGSDIVPGQIQFCREQFAHPFPTATFYCVQSGNPAYDHLITATASATPTIDEEGFFLEHSEVFDVVVAFSVFTHFDPTMAERYLKSLGGVTKPSGHLFLTWFLDHPSNPTESRLAPGQNFRDRDGDLGFSIFSIEAVAKLASCACLRVERISYGYWREWWPHALKGQHYQDIVILRPAGPSLPIEFDAQIYLAIHKDVADAGVDAVQHYLLYGHKEGRRLR